MDPITSSQGMAPCSQRRKRSISCGCVMATVLPAPRRRFDTAKRSISNRPRKRGKAIPFLSRLRRVGFRWSSRASSLQSNSRQATLCCNAGGVPHVGASLNSQPNHRPYPYEEVRGSHRLWFLHVPLPCRYRTLSLKQELVVSRSMPSSEPSSRRKPLLRSS